MAGLPAEYPVGKPLEVYQGDTFLIPQITIPNLTPRGGPADLTTATLAAQIRPKPESTEILAEFDIEKLDPVERQIKLTIPASETAPITAKKGFWDLQVTEGSWKQTILRGEVAFIKEVTRP